MLSFAETHERLTSNIGKFGSPVHHIDVMSRY